MGILFRWEQHFTEHRFNNMIWRDLTKLSSSTTGFHMTFTWFYQTIMVWWESYRRRRIDNLEEFWRPHWTFISRFCWLNPHVLLLKSLLFSWRKWHPPMILLLNSLFAAFNFIDSFSWISIVLWWNHLESICIQVVPRVFPLCSPVFVLAKCPCSVAVASRGLAAQRSPWRGRGRRCLHRAAAQ